MSEPGTSTSKAISPDSGVHWAEPGAWQVEKGIHRIPLPLPMDGLKAVNVYAVETPTGLTLIDGGWAVPEAREALDKGLSLIGAGVGDVTDVLVTHVHRDHYTLASVLQGEVGARVSLGAGEQATLGIVQRGEHGAIERQLRVAGGERLMAAWGSIEPPVPEPDHWRDPDVWLSGTVTVPVGARTVEAIHTPGHTQGHYVYADQGGGLLFAGDHVLPTITPSVGFEPAAVRSPLNDFMASLTRMRALPDLRLLPAHGPVAPSVHARVDELLEHHEHRLELSLSVIAGASCSAYEVAQELPWTRHEHRFETLDVFNGTLATLETLAHLDVLVARGLAVRTPGEDGDRFSAAVV